MRFFNWKLVKSDELQRLQNLSSEDASLSDLSRTRFYDLELERVVQNIIQTYNKLLNELQQLQEKQSILQARLAKYEQDNRSETKRKEARIEHMQTDFIASASHELKTPLAGIEALSDALEMALEDGNMQAAHNFIEHIKTETYRMRTLTEDLLDLSRFDENPDSDSVSNLRTAFENATVMPARTAEAKGIKLHVAINEDLEQTLLAKISPTDLSIVLDNLLDNALHYTKEGSIKLSLDISDNKSMWLLRVSDTGVGIAQHDQQHVFERFFRADRSRSRDNGGTGLGLSLVKKAVERWKGEIELQSELEVGSTFIIKLPVA